MCNLYSITKGPQAIRDFARAMRDKTGNLPPIPGIFPDYGDRGWLWDTSVREKVTGQLGPGAIGPQESRARQLWGRDPTESLPSKSLAAPKFSGRRLLLHRRPEST